MSNIDFNFWLHVARLFVVVGSIFALLGGSMTWFITSQISKKTNMEIQTLELENEQLKSEVVRVGKLAKPNTIKVKEVIKVDSNIEDRYLYRIKFESSENKPLNLVEIKTEIQPNTEGEFIGKYMIMGQVATIEVSEDKKTVNYKVGATPGKDLEIGVSILAPAPIMILISGNYGLEEQKLQLF